VSRSVPELVGVSAGQVRAYYARVDAQGAREGRRSSRAAAKARIKTEPSELDIRVRQMILLSAKATGRERPSPPVVLPDQGGGPMSRTMRRTKLEGGQKVVTETQVERITVEGISAQRLVRGGTDRVSAAAIRLNDTGASPSRRVRPNAAFLRAQANRAYGAAQDTARTLLT
jgi:hypothetical protein